MHQTPFNTSGTQYTIDMAGQIQRRPADELSTVLFSSHNGKSMIHQKVLDYFLNQGLAK